MVLCCFTQGLRKQHAKQELNSRLIKHRKVSIAQTLCEECVGEVFSTAVSWTIVLLNLSRDGSWDEKREDYRLDSISFIVGKKE
jgi:hypothetical protein